MSSRVALFSPTWVAGLTVMLTACSAPGPPSPDPAESEASAAPHPMRSAHRSREAAGAHEALMRKQMQNKMQAHHPGEQARQDVPDVQSRIPTAMDTPIAPLRAPEPSPAPGEAAHPPDTLRFESGQSTLKAETNDRITWIARFLHEHPEQRAHIEGHTDSHGNDAANQRLSEQRALAVRQALLNKGVAGSRLQAEGWGASAPVASNESAGGRQQNRRVVIVLSAVASSPDGPGARP